MPKGLAVVLLLAGIALAYANSLRGPFVFDDVPAIVENPTLRDPGNLSAVLFPPGDQAGTVGGRPLVNASLALNFAIGGTNVEGYHFFNVVVHALAALILFGTARRVLELSDLQDRVPQPSKDAAGPKWDRTAIAWIIALWWALHPLQTESVTYVVQRAESMMGLFYLGTLYCFLRMIEPARTDRIQKTVTNRNGWAVASVLCCAAGMMCKEVMVTAPLLILLCDRALVSGSFRTAGKAHRGLYMGYAVTWLILAGLVVSTHGRGGSAGFSSAPVSRYFLTQGEAMVHYLRLAVWPDQLVFDYGPVLVTRVGQVLGSFAILCALITLAGLGLVRNRTWGWVAFAFFLILAPTSSLLPIATEPRAEHRMYLPLASVCALAALCLARILWSVRPRLAAPVFLVVGSAVAVGLGFTTARRNHDYASEVALWRSVTRALPENPRGHNNLAEAWLAKGEAGEAEREFLSAVTADPTYLPAHYNLGALLLARGQPRAALPHLEKALSAPRHQSEAQRDLGEAFEQLDDPASAVAHFRAALQLDPRDVDAAFGLGNNLAAGGNLPEAVEALRIAARLAPEQARIRNNLGNALLFSGQVDAAVSEYRAALAREPGNAQIQENLRRALAAQPHAP